MRVADLAPKWEGEVAVLDAALAELKSATAALVERPDISTEARQRILAALERLADAPDGALIEFGAAGNAENSLVRIDEHAIARLCAAVRAGDVELCETLLGHGDRSSLVGRVDHDGLSRGGH